MMSIEKIKPVYSELQGYLAQAPKADNATFHQKEWVQYNDTIDELNKLTDKDYNKFKLVPVQGGLGYFVRIETYRQKLGGLIARLHEEYFSGEPVPFAEMPSTIISQSQNQNQSLQVQLLLEVNNLIHEKLNEAKEGSKEKKFLEKIKDSLASVKNVSHLITLLVTTAHQFGITIEQLKDLF